MRAHLAEPLEGVDPAARSRRQESRPFWRVKPVDCLLLLMIAMFIAPGVAADLKTAGRNPPAHSAQALEMSNTLRDILMRDKAYRHFRARLFITPDALEAYFAPQSEWGRKEMAVYREEWNKALGEISQGLRQRGLLEQALSPAGLSVPISQTHIDAIPGLRQVDKLLNFVDLEGCDQDKEPPNCTLVLFLRPGKNGDPELANIRFTDAQGNLLKVPGKSD